MIMTSLHELGKKQPEMVLSAIKGYLIKHQKVTYNYIFILMLTSLPIDELAKDTLGKLELRYEPGAEHAGIHGNPESGNHQVPSY